MPPGQAQLLNHTKQCFFSTEPETLGRGVGGSVFAAHMLSPARWGLDFATAVQMHLEES